MLYILVFSFIAMNLGVLLGKKICFSLVVTKMTVGFEIDFSLFVSRWFRTRLKPIGTRAISMEHLQLQIH